ncbi:MAG: VOC family protein [bacterium]
MNFKVTGPHHVSLLVSDTRRSLQFYCELLGLKRVERPELAFPGAWLALGDYQIHLLELPDPAAGAARPDHVGRDSHLAVRVSDIEKLQQALELAQIPFTRSKSGRAAIFCRDPDGNGLEFVAD